MSLNPDALEYNIMEVAEQWLGRLKRLIQKRTKTKNLKIASKTQISFNKCLENAQNASKTHRNIPTNRTQRLWNSIWEHFLLVKFSFTFYANKRRFHHRRRRRRHCQNRFRDLNSKASTTWKPSSWRGYQGIDPYCAIHGLFNFFIVRRLFSRVCILPGPHKSYK